MARLPFPDNGSRLALTAEGKPAVGRTYTVYTDAAGTEPADIAADLNGNPGAVIASSQLVTDAYGYLPRFWGPQDGADRLHVTDGVAPVTRIDADFDARLDTITAGAVTSVAGRTGAVTLTVADVSGAEAAVDAQAKADSAAAALAAHQSDTTAVHGIADTTALETTSGAQAKANAAQSAAVSTAAADATTKANAAQSAAQASSLQKSANLSDLSSAATGRTNLGLGDSAIRNVGTTAGTVVDGADGRLTDSRDPNAHSGTHAVAGSDPVQLAQSQVTGLGAVLAAKADLVGGKVPTSQIPAVAINTTFTVGSEAAMLALAATQGDVAIRTDFTPARAYQLSAADPSVLANWIQVEFGAVASVNGQTGVVVLAASDVDAPPATRLITAGNGLTGGGDLSADRTLSVTYGTSSGTAAQGNDSRITGALQAASNLADLANATTARTSLGLGNSATRAVGTTAGTVAAGDDSRITGAAQKSANLSDLGSPSAARTSLGLGGSATLDVGTTAGTVAAGDDARLSNARTPTAHAATHAVGQSDAIQVATSQVTGLDAALAAAVTLTGAQTVTGAKTFGVGALRDSGNQVYDATGVAGVDKTGTTDSAAALQTAIDASPYGSIWFLPVGFYLFNTQIILNRGRSLIGGGFYHQRDIFPVAYSDDWSGNSTFNGTIIRSTVTSGPAILVTSNGGNNVMAGTRLQNFMLIGPGSGTSTGIALGESTPRIAIRPIVDNVKVVNFSLGMSLTHVNEARFDIAFQGCVKAVSAGTDVNNIRWSQLNMQRCTDGMVFEDTGATTNQLTNQFDVLICQRITNTGIVVRGEGHTFISPYFEEAPTAAHFAAAKFCAMHNPTVQGPGIKTMTVANGSNNNEFWGLKTSTTAFTLVDSGLGNLFHGELPGLTPGTNAWLLDVANAIFKPPKYGSSTTTGPTMQYGSAFGWRFSTTGAAGWQGNGSPEGAISAAVGSIYHRLDGGAGTSLYVKEGGGSGNTGWVGK